MNPGGHPLASFRAAMGTVGFSLMKSLLPAFLGITLLAGTLSGQSVIFQAAPGQRDILLPGGAAANGSYAFWGAFNDIGSVTFSSPASIGAQWLTFDSTTVTSIFGQNGRFSKEVDWATAANAAFNGKQSFLWIVQTAGGAPVLSDFSNVTAQGVFSSSNASWLFPVHTAESPFSFIVTSSEVNQASWGSILSGSPGSLQLQSVSAVPEPSTYAAWAGAVMLGFAAWRRRRQRAKSARTRSSLIP